MASTTVHKNGALDPASTDKARLFASLEVLDQRVDWVPVGWQRLYADLRAKLRAIVCPGRFPIYVDGPCEHDGFLCIEAVTDDKVVQGVLRKARTKALCTCMFCGKPAKLREFCGRYSTLCSACSGLRRLHLELVEALDRPSQVNLEEMLADKPMIKAAIQQAREHADELQPDAAVAWLFDLMIHVERLTAN